MKNLRIIYILGLGRSGSTLTTTLLNFHPNIISVGEVNRILTKGLNSICSCGKELEKCHFWSRIFNNIIYELNISVNEIKFIMEDKEDKVHFFNPFKYVNQKYIDLNRAFYSEVSKESGNNIIVDSSKNIMRYFSIRKYFEINTITVIRNPFGVCWSLLKRHREGNRVGKIMLYSLLSYTFNNMLIIILSYFNKKMIVFKYEDTPQVINSDWFWNKIGLVEEYNPNKEYHIGFGNDLIYNFNPISYAFKEDIAYKKNLNFKWKFFVYLLTWPIMLIKKYKF